MLDFYIHFINDLNPGRMYNLRSVFPSEFLFETWPLIASWPQYEPDRKLVLQLQRDNITTITDSTFYGVSRHPDPIPLSTSHAPA